jgi:hypothetical protein
MALEYGLRVFLSKGGCEMGHEWGTQNYLLKMKIASGVTLKRFSGDPLGISSLGFGWFSLACR